MHLSAAKWCLVGYVAGAFWDLCKMSITIKSRERHGISNHRQLICSFNSIKQRKHWSVALSDGDFPTQRASKAESVFMSRYLHQVSIYWLPIIISKSINNIVGKTLLINVCLLLISRSMHQLPISFSTLTPTYNDAILSAAASQIAGVSIVYSTVCSGTDKKI